MRIKLIVVGILAAIAVVAVPGIVSAAKNVELETKLAGDDEPDGGDPDGKGKAEVKIKTNKGEACFDITFKRIEAPIMGHIHEGKPGEAGPIVVPFLDDPEGASSPIDTCVDADEGVLKDIKKKPKRFYVNLHTPDHQGGAIRGQLKEAKN